MFDWNKGIDACSYGAAAVIGKIKETVSRFKTVAPNCTSIHRILHRDALAVKRMPSDLKQVLDRSVKCVNFVKIRPLQSKLFKKLGEDIEIGKSVSSDYFNLKTRKHFFSVTGSPPERQQ
ncbi:zinc finger BED domain-containing protein 5-like [Diorhabda sublineata]|uniref:zinc finger BED domain-containing protein 5-like n=1 Tax=Diorhabda sublineata TaxID=1163346 RepID=UPI0024E1770E|nr:zinc finger BED domain-containing protein 5-like [Diorhabda sublineata]